MNFQQINTLGQILDTTFGKSSIGKSSTFSIKTKMSGNEIHVMYTTITNIVTDKPARDQVREQERISEKLIEDFIAQVKKDYKVAANETLKLKKGESTDEIEVISMSSFNPKRTAYYRRRAVYTVNN